MKRGSQKRGKGMQGPVEVQSIMVEALQWHKMDFQSPEGAEILEQEVQGAMSQ
jgi:hypothetical protein